MIIAPGRYIHLLDDERRLNLDQLCPPALLARLVVGMDELGLSPEDVLEADVGEGTIAFTAFDYDDEGQTRRGAHDVPDGAGMSTIGAALLLPCIKCGAMAGCTLSIERNGVLAHYGACLDHVHAVADRMLADVRHRLPVEVDVGERVLEVGHVDDDGMYHPHA